jgi:hypothetical protein
MALIPKINLKKTGGLVAGGYAAKKVGGLIPIQNEMAKKAAPLVLGLILSGQRDGFISGAGDGMIAVAGSELIDGLLAGAGSGLGLGGVLMGNADVSDFSSDSYDTSASAGGEMNY